MPSKLTPLKLTVLALPTLESANVGAWLVTLSTSPGNKLVKDKRPLAAVVPSYTLLLAVAVNTGVPGAGVTPGTAGAIWKGLITKLLLLYVMV